MFVVVSDACSERRETHNVSSDAEADCNKAQGSVGVRHRNCASDRYRISVTVKNN